MRKLRNIMLDDGRSCTIVYGLNGSIEMIKRNRQDGTDISLDLDGPTATKVLAKLAASSKVRP